MTTNAYTHTRTHITHIRFICSILHSLVHKIDHQTCDKRKGTGIQWILTRQQTTWKLSFGVTQDVGYCDHFCVVLCCCCCCSRMNRGAGLLPDHLHFVVCMINVLPLGGRVGRPCSFIRHVIQHND